MHEQAGFAEQRRFYPPFDRMHSRLSSSRTVAAIHCNVDQDRTFTDPMGIAEWETGEIRQDWSIQLFSGTSSPHRNHSHHLATMLGISSSRGLPQARLQIRDRHSLSFTVSDEF